MPKAPAPVKKRSPTFGRPSVFRNKQGGARVGGVITAHGSIKFEAARKRLAKLDGREVEHTSDADVIEYLSRGDEATRKHLAEQQKHQS